MRCRLTEALAASPSHAHSIRHSSLLRSILFLRHLPVLITCVFLLSVASCTVLRVLCVQAQSGILSLVPSLSPCPPSLSYLPLFIHPLDRADCCSLPSPFLRSPLPCPILSLFSLSPSLDGHDHQRPVRAQVGPYCEGGQGGQWSAALRALRGER